MSKRTARCGWALYMHRTSAGRWHRPPRNRQPRLDRFAKEIKPKTTLRSGEIVHLPPRIPRRRLRVHAEEMTVTKAVNLETRRTARGEHERLLHRTARAEIKPTTAIRRTGALLYLAHPSDGPGPRNSNRRDKRQTHPTGKADATHQCSGPYQRKARAEMGRDLPPRLPTYPQSSCTPHCRAPNCASSAEYPASTHSPTRGPHLCATT